jgi:iron complex outermembrane recepter protein
MHERYTSSACHSGGQRPGGRLRSGRWTFCAATALAGLMVMAQAAAQSAPSADGPDTGLSEVVVTATKVGATSLQKTPLAIAAFTADQLNESLALNVKDIALYTPNLQVSQVATNAVIAIRGIGSNNVYAGSDPDVTMQIDGVYIARPSGQFADFLDLDRVEVLRGPQGTLYGRNAVGGTINLISRQPTDSFDSQQVFTFGNYGLAQGQAYVSGPLIPGTLQGSLSMDYIYHDDYELNVAPDAQRGIDNANHGGVRGQLRYEPADNIDMTTRADWSYLHESTESYDHLVVPYPTDTLGATIIGNYNRVALNTPQTNYQHAGGISEDVNVRFGDHYSLRSISAYRTDSYSYFLDTDDTPLNVNFGPIQETERQVTQELDFNANYSHLTAVAGLFYFYEDDQQVSEVIVPAASAAKATEPEVWTHSGAAFAQATYEFLPDLKLTVGGRYTRETKSVEANYEGLKLSPSLAPIGNLPGFPINFSTAPTFDAFTPKFGLDWQATPDALLYASATRGYKSGGVNFAATSLSTASFQPEYIWSYEVGAKTEWLDRRLRANLTAFYYDYKNLQVQSSLAAGVSVIGNAATATDKGLEAELVAQVTPAFQVNAEVSYLDARYSSFPDASVPSALKQFVVGDPNYDSTRSTYDASGNYLNYAPRYSGSVRGQYDWRLSSTAALFARGDVYYQSRTYYDPSNSLLLSQAGYPLVNASLGYRSDVNGWTFELWGKNLADRQYLIAMAASSLEPAGVAGAPRTFGIRIGKRW